MPTFHRIVLCLGLTAPSAQASDGQASSLCLLAAEKAAGETGVPERLLRAITRVETQYDGDPWPWTINVDGKGHWFPNRAEAEVAAQVAVGEGGSADIGCFQINTRWHSDAFPSIEAMLDPELNALYAARHLIDLHRQKGNWSDAVAAYHSQDADRGRGYVERVGAILANEDSSPAEPVRRQNGFPFLVAGAEGAPGSLVPRQSGRPPLVGGP